MGSVVFTAVGAVWGILYFLLREYRAAAITAGVIERKKISFDVWEDAVNAASRMQSHSLLEQVQISQLTYELIKNDFVCESPVKSM